MRGRREPQITMLAFIDPEGGVPPAHPLRAIKRLADQALAELSPAFDGMYAEGGRPSIPPERLLKASLLIALYKVFGWMKTVGGFRRTRYRGLDRTGLAGYLVATAYNLVRLGRLMPTRTEIPAAAW